MLPLKVLLTSCVTDAGIMPELKPHQVTPLNNSQEVQATMVPSILLLASHDTDVDSGTCTGIKVIYSTSKQSPKYPDFKGVIDGMISITWQENLLLPHMCQQLKFPSNVIYSQHMPISSCAHVTQLCQHIYLIWTHCKNNKTRNNIIYTFPFTGICFWTLCLSHCTYVSH